MKRVRLKMIPINRPDVKLKDFITFFRPKVSNDELESTFSKWLGEERHCLLTSSGKIAIYLLFKFLNIKGNVVTTPLTCSVAIKPILANNISLKFADIDPETFNIDVDSLQTTIDKKTEAIYVIHLGGNPCDLKPIKEIADERNIFLIEDCAQSLGSYYNGRKVGTFGDYSCFSFSKNVWLCGGGMICGNNNDILEEIRNYQKKLPNIPKGLLYYRLIRDFIESKRGNHLFDWIYYRKFLKNAKNANANVQIDSYFQMPDVLHKPSNIQASIIKSQLSDLDIKNMKRTANAKYLTALLSQTFNPQKIEKASESVYSKYYLLSNIASEKMIVYLESKGIDAKHLTKSHGFHFQTRFDRDEVFKNFKSIEQCINYKEIHDRIFTLPISSNMGKKELLNIAETLQKAETEGLT